MRADAVRPADVDGDERFVRYARSFEDSRRADVDQLARAPHPLVHRGVRQIDQHAAGEVTARELADLFALIEAVPEHFVGLQLQRVWLVDFPPEELVALDAGGVARLRETVRHR